MEQRGGTRAASHRIALHPPRHAIWPPPDSHSDPSLSAPQQPAQASSEVHQRASAISPGARHMPVTTALGLQIFAEGPRVLCREALLWETVQTGACSQATA